MLHSSIPPNVPSPLRLIYTKSGFYARPRDALDHSRDIHGFFAVVSRHQTDVDIAIAWIPEYLVDDSDLETFTSLDGILASEQGFPNVQWLAGQDEAMLIPITDIHSLYVCPPFNPFHPCPQSTGFDQDNSGSIIITTCQGDVLRPLWFRSAVSSWPGLDIIDIISAFQPTTDAVDITMDASIPSGPSPDMTTADDPLRRAVREARFNILERFSQLTRLSRDTANHPIAKTILPLLPASIQGMVRNMIVQETMNDYDRATLYLAQLDAERTLLFTLNASIKPPPTHTRREELRPEEWVDFFDNEGKLRVNESYILGLIFRSGLHPDVRIEAWKFLLGIYPWDSTFDEREAIRRSKMDEYYEIKALWFNDTEERNKPKFQDEKHRIDKDVHRTDRTLAVFEGDNLPNPDPQMVVGTNANLEIMKDILVTYNYYNTKLGYVQGMSDLLAPIFVAMGTEEMAFWCFVQFMNRVQSNFFIDQSGMYGQLQTLDALIRFMDAQLYKHFEDTETSNLFFCFRWLLVWFKREFEWDDVIRLWEILWTNHMSSQMIMFFALAVLDQHRQALLNLNQFDEVLKYINELSGTIDLNETLQRTEVLFRLFERRIRAMDKKRMQLEETLQLRSVWNSEERPRIEKDIEELKVDGRLRALLLTDIRAP
ncbi:rab-GTPase-TBC domain-containing protein [Dichotomocladium elegans]|nr:rab-GTPase-TBC domain-containing protein [Dichotomocladium elegans]